ncbi:MAG: hypothetical protein GDA50_06315 [Alphaproteobacteria bacterium GM202ARS2]|nr:hypothetical protein [Alphaproteobacteria bacterium GM202ARS2]
MMSLTEFYIEPLIPVAVLGILACLAVVFVLLVKPRFWQACAYATLLLALAHPQQEHITYHTIPPKVALLIDQTSSQSHHNGARIRDQWLQDITRQLKALGITSIDRMTWHESTERTASGSTSQRGSWLRPQLDKLATNHENNLGGIIILTDGQAHDAPALTIDDVPPSLRNTPIHVLITGDTDTIDRRLRILQAPRFALKDEAVSIRLHIDSTHPTSAPVTVEERINGTLTATHTLKPDTPHTLTITLKEEGANIIELSVPPQTGESQERLSNNHHIVPITTWRKKVKVLLVSGQPSQSERFWRTMLTQNATLDLVHLIILRTPATPVLVPSTQLSLIPFPTDEIFIHKLHHFDLVIFERYQRRGMLTTRHIDKLHTYVKNGGALLEILGPESVGAMGLNYTPLSPVLPLGAAVAEQRISFVPEKTDKGTYHPITQGLSFPRESPWLRVMTTSNTHANTLLATPQAVPLLAVTTYHEGRSAQLTSDHLWLWWRTQQGDETPRQLVRHIANWLTRHPSMHDTRLSTTLNNNQLTLQRHSIPLDDPLDAHVTLTAPDKSQQRIPWQQGNSPHDSTAQARLDQQGTYLVASDDRMVTVRLGSDSLDQDDRAPDPNKLKQLVDGAKGGIFLPQHPQPTVRLLDAPQSSWASKSLSLNPWLGIANTTQRISDGTSHRSALLPTWLLALLAVTFTLLTWRYWAR